MSRLGEFVYGGIARLGREETGIFNILFFFFRQFLRIHFHYVQDFVRTFSHAAIVPTLSDAFA
jgi:hypothetical protein